MLINILDFFYFPILNPKLVAKMSKNNSSTENITLKQNFLFGKAFEFRSNPIDFLEKTAQDYPSIARFRFAHLPMVLLTEPDTVKHILQTNNKNYAKGIEYEHLKPVLGEGLLTSEGDFWLRQRRLSQPAFHKEKISHFTAKMVHFTNEMVQNWKTKKGFFDIHSEMMHLALQIVSSTLLSYELKTEVHEVENALEIAINESYHRIQALINYPLWLPVPRNLKYAKSRESLDKVVNSIIEERRNSKKEYHDLLDMLMNVRDLDTGEGMSDKQLRDEVMTIFLAGHETTANALTWAFYLLSENPEVEKKFFEEIDGVLGNRLPTFDDLKNLTYITEIIHESLRLYPPAWIIGRTALADDEIKGYEINKGDNIMVSPYQMHRSHLYWENPDKFIPERFSAEKMKEMHKFVYFPFGGGPRFCIGNNFALLEMQIILAMVGQQFKLKHRTGHQVELDPVITLRPKNGMPMEILSRF